MFKKLWKRWEWFFIRTILYSQEIAVGVAWLAFAFFSSNAPIINLLETEYPVIAVVFHVAFAISGLLLIAATLRPEIFLPAWTFSLFVALSTLTASLGVDGINNAPLYPVTWALLLFVSATQTLRHFWIDRLGT